MTISQNSDVALVSYRRYSRLLIIAVMLPVMAALIGSFFFQPYWGPLTRLGGLLENDYGWNTPQEAFDEPLSTIAWKIREYDRYYDVVVVGDSFSYDERKGWQNYFVEKTGLSVITLHHGIGLDKVVASEMFRTNPPRYLILESEEQFALVRLAKLKMLRPLEPVSDGSPQRSLPVIVARPRALNRDMTPPLGSKTIPPLETRIDQSLNHLIKTLSRRIFGETTEEGLRKLWGTNLENKTFILPLRQDVGSLFSSRKKDSLLVYSLDIAKVTNEAIVKQAAEGAWQMKKSVEANGKTKVMMMIFPDKLSVYAPYLVDPSVAPPSIIPQLANLYPYQIRLDEVFAKAVADGVQDLYLPDDTHCGYKGYKMAAEQLANAIDDKMQLSLLHQ